MVLMICNVHYGDTRYDSTPRRQPKKGCQTTILWNKQRPTLPVHHHPPHSDPHHPSKNRRRKTQVIRDDGLALVKDYEGWVDYQTNSLSKDFDRSLSSDVTVVEEEEEGEGGEEYGSKRKKRRKTNKAQKNEKEEEKMEKINEVIDLLSSSDEEQEPEITTTTKETQEQEVRMGTKMHSLATKTMSRRRGAEGTLTNPQTQPPSWLASLFCSSAVRCGESTPLLITIESLAPLTQVYG